jgi:hypothetical protein
MAAVFAFAAALAAVQAPPAPAAPPVPAWPDERRLADHFGRGLAARAEGCVGSEDNRERVAEVLRKAGHAISPRSWRRGKAFTIYTEPKLHFGRLIYHYASVGDAMCLTGLCMTGYAAKIELPVAADGRTVPQRALNDPDRTTLAVFEEMEKIAERCAGGR